MNAPRLRLEGILPRIRAVFYHDDADGGLSAFELHHAIKIASGVETTLTSIHYRTFPADYSSLNLSNAAMTVDLQLKPGVWGVDHHDSSQAFYDPAYHILDLSASSCFSLILRLLGREKSWPPEIVSCIDRLDAGLYTGLLLRDDEKELSAGNFISVINQVGVETILQDLVRDETVTRIIDKYREPIKRDRQLMADSQAYLQRHNRWVGKVVLIDFADFKSETGASPRQFYQATIFSVFPQAHFAIRYSESEHNMAISGNPAIPNLKNVGAVCEQLRNPHDGHAGGGKQLLGGAYYTRENMEKALRLLAGSTIREEG
jgi:hypothetical protein